MRIIRDIDINEFDFWSGGKALAEKLTTLELDRIQEEIETTYPEGLTDTEINDIFWFDDNWIATILGFENEEELWKELLKREKEKYEKSNI